MKKKREREKSGRMEKMVEINVCNQRKSLDPRV